jgi:RNA polymerase sigma-70 factor (ECF subfamily)
LEADALNRQPPTAGNDDAALMARVAQRDPSALALLYDRYADMVFSVACRVVRDEALAEEIVQDVFLRLWQLGGRYDAARGSVPGWLVVVARNLGISRLRRRGANRESSPELAPADVVLTAGGSAELMALVGQVRRRLEQLSGAQREVLELAYFEGMSHTEIARRTQKPLGTVKTLLRSALAALRAAVGAPAEEAEP